MLLDGNRKGGERESMPRRFTLLAALLCSSCIGFESLSDAKLRRLDAFDFYWQHLADNYPFFGKELVDWSEMRQQYRSAVPFAERPHEFHHLLCGMLSELGDAHVSYSTPADLLIENGTEATSLLDRQGFELMRIDGKLHVIGWPGGEAPELPQGLPHHARFPELWRVGGFHVVPSLVSNLMLGPPDSEVELQLRWDDDVVTRHVVHRPPRGTKVVGSLLRRVLPSGAQAAAYDDRKNYMHLVINTLASELPLDPIDKWIDAALLKDGLVIDFRRNLGGNMNVGLKFLGRFISKPTNLIFAIRDESTTGGLVTVERFAGIPIKPRGKRYNKPIVVLTSSMTASMAEHTARILQRECGAILIGERTSGAEAGLVRIDGPEGGRLTYGETRLVDRTGVGLQVEGVVPDISIRVTQQNVAAFGPDRALTDWDERMFEAAERVIRNANAARK